jgi:hypothetical protein
MMDLLMSDENAGSTERAKELDYQLMHWLSHTNKGAKTGVKVALLLTAAAAAVLKAAGL